MLISNGFNTSERKILRDWNTYLFQTNHERLNEKGRGITPEEYVFTSLITWGLPIKALISFTYTSPNSGQRRGSMTKSLNSGPLLGGVGIVLLPVVDSGSLSTDINHS